MNKDQPSDKARSQPLEETGDDGKLPMVVKSVGTKAIAFDNQWSLSSSVRLSSKPPVTIRGRRHDNKVLCWYQKNPDQNEAPNTN